MLGGENTRRDTLKSAGVIGLGLLWGPALPASTVSAQAGPISIDRTVGDLVVLPLATDATVTGTSTLDPGTDFSVNVFSEESPTFFLQGGSVVADDGTWSETFDLSQFNDDQGATIEVIYNGDTVASAPGRLGPLTARLAFDDQEATNEGTFVRMTAVYLELGGFVSIREGDVTGPILGTSDFLSRDTTYEDLAIPLDAQVTGEQVLVATAHLDTNANQTFDYQEGSDIDRPYQQNGVPVTDEAVVTGVAQQETPTPTSTEPVITLTPPPETPPRGLPIDVGVGGAGGLAGAWAIHRLTKPPEPPENGPDPQPTRDPSTKQEKNKTDDDHIPTAQIAYTPQNPEPGRPVLFDGSLSYDLDPKDRLDSFTWNIGERTSHGKRVVHVFGQPEEVHVKLTVRNDRRESGSQTKTVTVEEREGRLELADVHPDSPGDDRENLHEEYVAFRNAGNEPLDLEDWTVYDAAEDEGRVAEGDHTHAIPAGVTLEPDDTVVIHTGSRPETTEYEEDAGEQHLFWAHHWPIWNNDEDVIVVADAEDNPVLATRYRRGGGGAYDFEDLDPAGLEAWFPDVTVEVPEEVRTEDVTIDAEVGRSALSNFGDFVAGALFLRGTKSFVRSWGLITGFLFFALLTWFVSTATGLLAATIDGFGPLVLLIGSLSVTFIGVIVHLLRGLIETRLEDGES